MAGPAGWPVRAFYTRAIPDRSAVSKRVPD
ncbi:hypothetical protein BH10PLA2_BH10PLA2_22980 [soil metagenome]